jgi:DNA polymerase-3 subunit gamma/tau
MPEPTKHIELYKAYRPRKWEDLIGQQKVAKSLRAAVLNDKLPTAYGFFGPRGCGKTSAALILAKAINCLDLDRKTGNPCGVCEVCRGFDAGTQFGFYYISMANNGNVDSVRDIVQKARLSQPLKRSVFILDEVHTISKQAFDALLIPLEDTTMPALFILCSTEVEKIPATILSRIQQRGFSLVGHDDMELHVKDIATREGLTLDQSVIEDAVRQGRGSVRDTMSALETLIETGEAAPSYSGKLLAAFATRDMVKTLAVVAEASANSVKGRELAEQLFEDLRDLLFVAAGVGDELIGVLPIADPKTAAKTLLGVKGLSHALDELGEGLNRISGGADARIQLEVSLVKTFARLSRLQKAAQAAAGS